MNQIKQGYKQTKVGIIPKDWDVVKIKEATSYVDYRGKTPIKTGKGIFLVTAKNIKQGFIDYEASSEFVSEVEYHEIMKRGMPKIGDILITTEAPLGNVAQIDKENIALAQRVIKFRSKKNVKNDFLKHYFLSNRFQSYLYRMAIGTTVLGIQGKELHNMSIVLPPIKEQEKIAEILTTWDEAITKQTELLRAKELLKIALMQKLLSGEVRFDGFSDEWEEVRLGEIGNSFNGLSGKTGEDFGIGEAKYITYKNIFDYSKIKLDIFENVQISNDEKQNLVQFGDIFFTVSSETPEEVGMSSVLLDNVSNTYLNSFCFGYRLNNFNTLDPYFARFYFRSFQMRDKISRLAQGSTRFNLSKNEIMKLKIKLPSLPEQQKIAEVLSLADDEINFLKNELEELKKQKKALMQKLLTGQVRVKV